MFAWYTGRVHKHDIKFLQSNSMGFEIGFCTQTQGESSLVPSCKPAWEVLHLERK